MAVGAPGHLGGKPRILDLAVIGFLVKPDGIGRQFVALHHGRIGVTMDTGHAVKFPGLIRIIFRRGMVDLCGMQSVTIGAGRGIIVAFHDCPAMTGGSILLIPVTFGAIFNHRLFLFRFQTGHGMDITMTVVTFEILMKIVVTGIIFFSNALVTIPA